MSGAAGGIDLDPGLRIARETGAWNYVPPEAELAMHDRIFGRAGNGGPLGALFNGFGDEAAFNAKVVMTNALSSGVNPRTVAPALAAALDTSRSRAQIIARNELVDAYRNAQLENYRANGDMLNGWLWSAAPGCCEACAFMDGSTHDLDEDMDSHVCCRCSPLPITRGWDDILGPLGIDTSDIADTAIDIGYEPMLDSFDEWGVVRQQELLGPAKYEAWARGDIQLSDLVGVRDDGEWGSPIYEKSLKELGLDARDYLGENAVAPAPELAPAVGEPSVVPRTGTYPDGREWHVRDYTGPTPPPQTETGAYAGLGRDDGAHWEPDWAYRSASDDWQDIAPRWMEADGKYPNTQCFRCDRIYEGPLSGEYPDHLVGGSHGVCPDCYAAGRRDFIRQSFVLHNPEATAEEIEAMVQNYLATTAEPSALSTAQLEQGARDEERFAKLPGDALSQKVADTLGQDTANDWADALGEHGQLHGPIADREEVLAWEPKETSAEVSEALRDQLHIHVNLDEFDPAIANQFAQTLQALNADWPEIFDEQVQYIGQTGRDFSQFNPTSTLGRTRSILASSDGSTIGFNRYFFSAARTDAADLVAVLQDQVERGWFYDGAGSPASQLAHEFGHSLYQWALTEERPEATRLVFDYLSRWSEEVPAFSRYAASDPHELFAEAFSAQYFGTPEVLADPMVADMGRLLDNLQQVLAEQPLADAAAPSAERAALGADVEREAALPVNVMGVDPNIIAIHPDDVAAWTANNAPDVPDIGYHNATPEGAANIRENGVDLTLAKGENALYGRGFYMYNDEGGLYAKMYKPEATEEVRFAVRMQNPIVIDSSDPARTFKVWGDRMMADHPDWVGQGTVAFQNHFTQWALDNGYDGIIRTMGDAAKAANPLVRDEVVMMKPGTVRVIDDAAPRLADMVGGTGRERLSALQPGITREELSDKGMAELRQMARDMDVQPARTKAETIDRILAKDAAAPKVAPVEPGEPSVVFHEHVPSSDPVVALRAQVDDRLAQRELLYGQQHDLLEEKATLENAQRDVAATIDRAEFQAKTDLYRATLDQTDPDVKRYLKDRAAYLKNGADEAAAKVEQNRLERVMDTLSLQGKQGGAEFAQAKADYDAAVNAAEKAQKASQRLWANLWEKSPGVYKPELDSIAGFNMKMRQMGITFSPQDIANAPSMVAARERIVAIEPRLAELKMQLQDLNRPLKTLNVEIKRSLTELRDLNVALGDSFDTMRPFSGALDLPEGKQPPNALMNKLDYRMHEPRPVTKGRIIDDISARLKEHPAWAEYVDRMPTPDNLGIYHQYVHVVADARDSKSAKLVADLVRKWGVGYRPGSPSWAALQMAARDEFGLDANLHAISAAQLRAGEAAYAKDGEALRAFVRAMYDNTQQWFADHGITEIDVYRGFAWSEGDSGLPTGINWGPLANQNRGITDIELNPFQSFSADINISQGTTHVGGFGGGFAQGKDYNLLIGARVPVDRVLSTAQTGFGAKLESEIVVLGRLTDTVAYRAGTRIEAALLRQAGEEAGLLPGEVRYTLADGAKVHVAASAAGTFTVTYEDGPQAKLGTLKRGASKTYKTVAGVNKLLKLMLLANTYIVP